MKSVTDLDIYEGLKKLEIIGERIVVHSSLKSFGYVEGGATTVIKVLANNFKTVLMPAFCWDSNTKPINEDRPLQNGCDYSFYDGWNKQKTPFIINGAGIEKSMGIISKKFISVSGVVRSDHPWHSWAAYGDMANIFVEDHQWEATNLPIERLADFGGWLVLLGVNLNACTAIHVSEENAGRRPFIRWAVDKNGIIKRVRASGCGKGFNNLASYCNGLFKETHIGKARILTTPLKAFMDHITKVIISFPELTRCSDTCLRCRDSILGGPIER